MNVEQAKLAVEMGAKYKADGTLNAIYLADEICGFAVHLVGNK